ncbi:14685_t:CDS:2, partial [Cetraspora pellucida]
NNITIENIHKPRKILPRTKCACTSCRKLKKKCVGGISGKKPCERCEKGNRECVYTTGFRPRDPHKISNRSNGNGNGNGNPVVTRQADLQYDHNDIGVINVSDQYNI